MKTRITPLIALVFCLSLDAQTLKQLNFGGENLSSDDISILQASSVGSLDLGNWETTISIAHTHYDIDYKKDENSFIGESKNRVETNNSLQINARHDLNNGLTLLVGGGTYDGYTSYVSIWLDEYFYQRNGNLPDSIPGDAYVIAAPQGYSATIGARWEYWQAVGFAQFTVSHLKDDVSPGYEIGIDGLFRGALELETNSVSLSTENIVSKRIRSLLEITASETTDRKTRYTALYSINTAINDNIIWQLRFGGATENPHFNAQFATSKLEYTLSDKLSLYIDASYYNDTGEITNADMFTSATPEVISRRAGIGLRWTGENGSIRGYYGPSSQRFRNEGAASSFFENLYKNRDWDIFQIVVGKTF